MRFHIGFSKFIKPKKIIEFLGFLLIGLLAFFGFIQHGYAWTNVSYERGLYTHGNVNYWNTTDFSEPIFYDNLGIYEGFYNDFGMIKDNSNDNYLTFYPPTSFSFASSTGASPFFITDEMNVFFNNDSYCLNSSNDLKSINFKIKVYPSFTNEFVDYSQFNITSKYDLFNVMMVAYDNTNDLNFSTICSFESEFNNNGYWIYSCNNVFQGNTEYNIDEFSIRLLNGVPFNNRVLTSSDSYGVRTYALGFGGFEYECSNDEPSLEGGFPVDDDPAGLNDIYNEIRGNYDLNIPGIDTTNFLTIPNSMADLFMLPLNLINIVVENSDTCSTYEIDFSSIMTKWGNPTDEYKLRLPCMREVLSNKLGAFYTLCDYLMATFVFYNIIMNLLQLIDAITSGEDIYSYFFKRENESANNGGYKHYNSDTGEVW